MKRVIFLLFFLLTLIFFTPQNSSAQVVTVTGHLKSGNTNSLTAQTFLRFRLRNFSGNVPRISGTGDIAQT